MEGQEVIFPDSEKAASLQTVTGWVSRLGHFYGNDEQLARYDGSTHRKCDCGEVIERNGYCWKCYERKENDKFLKMERKEWNGTDALYDRIGERFFFSESDLDDYCYENETTPDALELIICVPQEAYTVDPVEIYEDILPEDNYELPADIKDAFDDLNRAIEESKSVISWIPGKYAAIIT